MGVLYVPDQEVQNAKGNIVQTRGEKVTMIVHK